MANMFTTIAREVGQSEIDPRIAAAGSLLRGLIPPDAYVGEVYSLGYEDALVQIQDFHRRAVGGIPALSFLIATRITPNGDVDVQQEDARPPLGVSVPVSPAAVVDVRLRTMGISEVSPTQYHTGWR